MQLRMSRVVLGIFLHCPPVTLEIICFCTTAVWINRYKNPTIPGLPLKSSGRWNNAPIPIPAVPPHLSGSYAVPGISPCSTGSSQLYSLWSWTRTHTVFSNTRNIVIYLCLSPASLQRQPSYHELQSNDLSSILFLLLSCEALPSTHLTSLLLRIHKAFHHKVERLFYKEMV